MEELLQQKNYYCKPNSGLKMNCKLISGLINKNCKLFLGRYSKRSARTTTDHGVSIRSGE